jgi:Rod binding domain-containing protein
MDKMPIFNSVNPGKTPSSDPKPEKRQMDPEKLKKASTEFESLFINEMLKFMRKIVPAAAPGGLSSGKDIYQTLFDQELSKNLAQRGGLRIGEMVYRQMNRRSENAHPQTEDIKGFPEKNGTKKD